MLTSMQYDFPSFFQENSCCAVSLKDQSRLIYQMTKKQSLKPGYLTYCRSSEQNTLIRQSLTSPIIELGLNVNNKNLCPLVLNYTFDKSSKTNR